MKLSINQTDFASGLARATRATEAKPLIDVLSNVLLSAKDGNLTITGFGMDQRISITVPCEIEKEGEVAAPGLRLASVSARFKSGSIVNLESDDKNLKVVSGGSRYSMQIVGPDAFPKIEAIEGSEFTIDNIGSVISAASAFHAKDGVRAYLGATLFKSVNGKMNAYASDGKKMIAIAVTGKSVDDFEAFVHWSSCANILHAFGNEAVSCVVSDRAIQVSSGDALAKFNLVDGAPPSFADAMENTLNSAGEVSASFQADDMSSALKRLLMVGNIGKDNCVRLDIGKDKITVSAKDAFARGDGNEDVSAISDHEFAIGMNGQHMIDFLDKCEGEVLFKWTDASSKTFFECVAKPEWRVVIMPVRI